MNISTLNVILTLFLRWHTVRVQSGEHVVMRLPVLLHAVYFHIQISYINVSL